MYKKLVLAISLLLPVGAYAADVLKANRLFSEKSYPQAMHEYQQAAELGNPQAYYQLAIMHNLGLGGKKDIFSALLYFSLAADANYHNAQAMVEKMLSNISAEAKQGILTALADYKKQMNLPAIQTTYYPELNPSNLGEKITFDGKATLENKFYAEDFNELENSTLETGFEDEEDDLAPIMATPRKPFLIVDNDVATDGSIRYVAPVQKFGVLKNIIDNYVLFPGPKPQFKGQPVEFVNRGYLGAAVFDQFSLREENERLYMQVRHLAKKMRNATSLADRYQYAMALLNFHWLPQEEGEVEQRLLALSKEGHPSAMYEYGLKLYREQRDIPEAIHWIGKASSYGLARAEYRLAKLLQTSPWVVRDDKKALFWYESAVAKDHLPSTLRAIEIKLKSTDESLKDVNGAIEYLAKIEKSHKNNPEYYYLLAQSHRYRENRVFTEAVYNMRRAISAGQTQNWDVSDWEDELAQMTTGKVYIIED